MCHKLPACCAHHTAPSRESQQPGGKLHTLFTDWSKTDDFIHKMFKIRKQFARRSSAVLPVGGIGICLTAVWPSQRISALIENVGHILGDRDPSIDIRHHGSHLYRIRRREGEAQLRQLVKIKFLKPWKLSGFSQALPRLPVSDF